jgi:hypothetical protein
MRRNEAMDEAIARFNARTPRQETGTAEEIWKKFDEMDKLPELEREKAYAIDSIQQGNDEYIFWFVSDNRAYCFMADHAEYLEDCDNRVIEWRDREKLLEEQELTYTSDGQCAVRGTKEELEEVFRMLAKQ